MTDNELGLVVLVILGLVWFVAWFRGLWSALR